MKWKRPNATSCWVVCALVLPCCGLLLNPILTPTYLAGLDYRAALHPTYVFLIESIKNGEFPLWNPYTLCGHPTVSTVACGYYYPPNGLLLLFGPRLGPVLNILAHILAGTLLFYALLRHIGFSRWASVLGSQSFFLSKYIADMVFLGHYPQLYTICWFPGLTLALIRGQATKKPRWFFLASLAIGGQFTCAHPQYFLFSQVCTLILYSWIASRSDKFMYAMKRLILAHILCGIFGAILGACYLFPILEETTRSLRGTIPFDWICTLHTTPLQLFTLLIPKLFGSELQGLYWGTGNYSISCMFWGLSVTLLAWVGLKNTEGMSRWILCGTAVVGILLSLGPYGGLYWLAYKIVPGFHFFRLPSRCRIFSILAISLLASCGTHALEKNSQSLAQKWPKIVTGVWGTMLLFFALSLRSAPVANWALAYVRQALSTPNGSFQNHLSQFLMSGLGSVPFVPDQALQPLILQAFRIASTSALTGSIVLLSIMGMLFFFNRAKMFLPLMGPCLGWLVILELVWVHHTSYATLTQEQMRFISPQAETFLSKVIPGYRVATVNRMGDLGRGMHLGLEHVDGWGALILKPNLLYMAAHHDMEPEWASLIQVQRTGRLTDMLSLKYLIARERLHDPKLRPLSSGPMEFLYEIPTAFPKLRLLHAIEVAPRDDMAKVLLDPRHDPLKIALVEHDIPLTPLSDPAPHLVESARILQSSPNRLTLDVTTPMEGILVVSQSYHPGWKAFIDNKQIPTFLADGMLCGIKVPTGSNRIELHYKPKWQWIGLYTSCIGLIAWTVALCVMAKVRRL